MIMSYKEACKLQPGDIVTVAPFQEIVDFAKENDFEVQLDEYGTPMDVVTPCVFVDEMKEFCGKPYVIASLEVPDFRSGIKYVRIRFRSRGYKDADCYTFDNFMLLSNEETDNAVPDEEFEKLF